MKIFLKVLILTAACVVIIKSCSPYLGVKNQLIGQSAPDFTLEMLSGKTVNMTQLRDGRPAIIFFWATWCPHCRKQLKELTESRDEIGSKGIRIILVDVGEARQKVMHYMKSNGVPFDTFLDQSEELSLKYGLVGVPTFFLLNNEGIVVAAENILPSNYGDILLGLLTS